MPDPRALLPGTSLNERSVNYDRSDSPLRPLVWLWLPAIVGLTVLVAAGCGGNGDPAPTAALPTPEPTAPPGTSGPGVTETEIHLGMTSCSSYGSSEWGAALK